VSVVSVAKTCPSDVRLSCRCAENVCVALSRQTVTAEDICKAVFGKPLGAGDLQYVFVRGLGAPASECAVCPRPDPLCLYRHLCVCICVSASAYAAASASARLHLYLVLWLADDSVAVP